MVTACHSMQTCESGNMAAALPFEAFNVISITDHRKRHWGTVYSTYSGIRAGPQLARASLKTGTPTSLNAHAPQHAAGCGYS